MKSSAKLSYVKLVASSFVALAAVLSYAGPDDPKQRQTERTIIVPAPQVIVNPNLKADLTATLKQNPANPWADIGKQFLTVLASWGGAGIGGFVAYRVMLEKAAKDDASEKRKQRAQRHKERADALSELIGEVLSFTAAAFRANEAFTTFHSYHKDKNPEWENKRQEFFAETKSLRSDMARVVAKAEKYGRLSNVKRFDNHNLSLFVDTWLGFIYADVASKDGDRTQYRKRREELVADLRQLRDYEDAIRTSILEDSPAPPTLEMDMFHYLEDRMRELGEA